MHKFEYKDHKNLYCEDIKIEDIAREVGTPFYLYSYDTIVRHFTEFDSAYKGIPHITCFAMKANSNLAVLKTLINQGSGVDIVSGGELFRALVAGASPDKIVYAGVGKTKEEIKYALESNILMFNVESKDELTAINEVAKALGKKGRVALRINPDIDPETHPYISTGLKENKFGIALQNALREYKEAAAMSNIEVAGIHAHIGSQITKIAPFVESLKKVTAFTEDLKREGINIRYLNVGGGLGITYNEETPPHPRELAAELLPIFSKYNYTVIFEPGRVIIGNAGVLVTKVLYTKSNETKKFFIVDAGMNDLIRPALYESYQEIVPVKKDDKRGNVLGDVVGPICESGDFLAKDRDLFDFKKDELIAVMSAGAYGATMSSNYNSRLLVPEVLVSGDRYYIVRERQTREDMIKGETIPDFLR